VPGPVATSDPQWVTDAYHAHVREVWGLLGRLGVARSNLEDAVQEVFLVLHRRREEFRGDSTLRTWIHGIAVNVARREYERRMRDARSLPSDDPPPTSADPELAARDREAIARLDRLLAPLSIEQREVFVLAEIADLTAPEIARMVGANLNTVYSRLRLARAHVQRLQDGERGVDDGRA
jgi:RNA polymerase sigma-70 factor (ECF subfamily)